MTNRVLLNSSGLKISKPGVNVIGASIADLNFNSDYSQMGLYRQGTYNWNWSTTPNPLLINLGKTFPTPPLVTFACTNAQYTYGSPYGGPSGFWFEYYEDNLGDGSDYRYWWLLGRVTTTQIAVDWAWEKFVPGDPTPPAPVIHYSIWDYNL